MKVWVVVWQDTEARGEQAAQIHGVYANWHAAMAAVAVYADEQGGGAAQTYPNDPLVWDIDDLQRMTISEHEVQV